MRTNLSMRLAAGLIGVFVLAGCTAQSDESVTPAPSNSQAPAPTDAPSTPEQWGAVAQQQQLEWVEWLGNWDLASCESMQDLSASNIDCTVAVFSAIGMVGTAAELWPALTTPGHSEFISTTPPQEVADLIPPTAAAAAAAAEAGTAWSESGCGSVAEDACVDLGATLETALASYRDSLVPWEPFMASNG
ncbi:hypothetical protein LG299_03305 [Microbacterium lacus]|uniref:hypothetical protein n=1 Tax=Microbacterium lacus TaxID=415217 RepID=UPI00384CBF6E